MSESLLNKVASLQLQHECFLVNIAKFLRTFFLKNICGWLLLKAYPEKQTLSYEIQGILSMKKKPVKNGQYFSGDFPRPIILRG